MSLKITPIQFNILSDQNGNKLFEFPCDTTLDKIIPDLWSDVVKYMNYYPFAFGVSGTTYPGYRIMKKEEFEACKGKFCDNYNKNKGIKFLPNKNCNGALMWYAFVETEKILLEYEETYCKTTETEKMIIHNSHDNIYFSHRTIDIGKLSLCPFAIGNSGYMILLIPEL